MSREDGMKELKDLSNDELCERVELASFKTDAERELAKRLRESERDRLALDELARIAEPGLIPGCLRLGAIAANNQPHAHAAILARKEKK